MKKALTVVTIIWLVSCTQASPDASSHAQILMEKAAPIVGANGLTTEAIGIETLGGVFTSIIKSGTKVPLSEVYVFSTAVDHQDQITIHPYRGSADMAKENHPLGSFQIYGIEPVKKGQPQIALIFTVTAAGDIMLSAKDDKTGKTMGIRRIEPNAT
jgi:molecular chaperone DnaK (HSP70)